MLVLANCSRRFALNARVDSDSAWLSRRRHREPEKQSQITAILGPCWKLEVTMRCGAQAGLSQEPEFLARLRCCSLARLSAACNHHPRGIRGHCVSLNQVREHVAGAVAYSICDGRQG
jgi:hypothetical protein